MSVIGPGATLGVIGGGQLGRMFVEAAHRLHYKVAVLAAEAACPAGLVADCMILGSQDDPKVVHTFARMVDALTYENELVPWECLAAAAEATLVRPGPEVLRIAQDRISQRRFLLRHAIPVAPFSTIEAGMDPSTAFAGLQFPLVMKASRNGYDGRSQARVERPEELFPAWASLGQVPVLIEQRVTLAVEFSIVLARAVDGTVVVYEPIENVHVDGILDTSVCPSAIPAAAARVGREIADTIARELGLVGVVCVEFFLTADGCVLVNEFATRPHNSGHLTIEACESSQFEQQLRALVGLPLGSARLTSPAAMANLVGIYSPDGEGFPVPRTSTLHWYGKQPMAGRKVGHITTCGEDAAAALREAMEVRDAVRANGHPSS